MKSKFLLLPLLATCFAFTACNYDAPLTEKPTRKVDERLLGSWVDDNKEDKKREVMIVRKLDDSTYVVAFDNDIYRAFHSDFAGTAFLSIQDLNADNRKYVYFVWQLSADNTQLTLVGVSTKVVPESTKGQAALQKLIKQHLKNPELFGDPLTFTRKNPR